MYVYNIHACIQVICLYVRIRVCVHAWLPEKIAYLDEDEEEDNDELELELDELELEEDEDEDEELRTYVIKTHYQTYTDRYSWAAQLRAN